jgi:heptosyltransferase-2
MRAPGRIVVRAPNWLGDLMMSTAFLRAVVALYPEAAVDLVVPAGFEALPLPHRGRLIPFDIRGDRVGAFGASLRGAAYDRFYVLPPSFSAAWMAWRSGAPERIGYRGEFRAPFLRPAHRHRARPRSVHLVREYLDLLDPALETERWLPQLVPPAGWVDERLSRIGRTLPDRFVALAPGAIYGPAKEWPVDRYRELARELGGRAGLPVLVLGTKKEEDLGETIRAGERAVQNWCGATDLPGLVAVLARASLLVSNDSGAMHVTAALQRPQIALFGSTSPEWTGPLNPWAEVVTRRLACAPCFARRCRYGHYDCLRTISAPEVLERAVALLARWGDRPLP